MTPAVAMVRPSCAVGACERPAERIVDGVPICATHRKRILRGRQRLTDPVHARPRDLSPLERVILTGSLFLEVSSEDDRAFDVALERFQRACAAWMRSLGWTPPAALLAAEDERR